MKYVNIFNGTKSVPVTDAFHAWTYGMFPRLAAMSVDQLESERQGLLKLSTARYGAGMPGLTYEDAAYLDALTDVQNMHRAVTWMGDTPLTNFGFEGADQIHGNHHHKSCGCVLRVVFDHHVRHLPDKLTVMAHTPLMTCDNHPWKPGEDHVAHFEKVTADTKA